MGERKDLLMMRPQKCNLKGDVPPSAGSVVTGGSQPGPSGAQPISDRTIEGWHWPQPARFGRFSQQLVRRSSGKSEHPPVLLHLLSSKPEMPNGTRIVKEVIAANADVNARSSTGLTPLILACRHKHIGAMELLMSNSVMMDPVDDGGKNAACYAVMRDPDVVASEQLSCELVTLLFNARANLDEGGKIAPIVQAVQESPLLSAGCIMGSRIRCIHIQLESYLWTHVIG